MENTNTNENVTVTEPTVIVKHEVAEESNSSKIKKTIICIAGVVTAGVAIYCGIKLHGICKELDLSLSDLKNLTHIDISDKLVEKATKEAADSAAKKVAKRAAEEIAEDVSHSIRNQVAEAIKNSYNSIKGKVAQEVKEQVCRMSIEDLREEVKDDAREYIQDKLESDMDDILHDYNKQLESVGKIYDSIASKLSASTDTAGGKNINLKLG